ncbi:cytochrome b/b6 domain-containing protein [Allosediminivita pacifica]|uniref:Cytochrome b561-like protein n=1 Tax=Allosediminivita pacifica TaxID=1267769 RepID=A0A2T6AYD0_9RHOB|nr:cytochrome b561-like protein [Allosediminivita pacifica]
MQWGIVFAVQLNGFVDEEGDTVHVWAGWIVLALLLLRLLWGIAGPAPARFASFPPDPAAALRHLRRLFRDKAHAHSSHNPVGP